MQPRVNISSDWRINKQKEKAIKSLNFKSDKGILYVDITGGFC